MNPSLTTLEGLAGLLFLGLIAIVVSGALIAVHAQALIRSLSGLILCFLGVAGLYYYLHSPFLALMEMLIYIGAVGVVIVFAIMLSEPRPDLLVGKQHLMAGVSSLVVGTLLFWGLASLGTRTEWQAAGSKLNDGSVVEIGEALLGNFGMVFEMISVVLLVAIIGALVLARSGRDRI